MMKKETVLKKLSKKNAVECFGDVSGTSFRISYDGGKWMVTLYNITRSCNLSFLGNSWKCSTKEVAIDSAFEYLGKVEKCLSVRH